MQLSQLSLRNYRSCRDTSVAFAPDLTVVVGENAAGKSSIVDALRLATFPSTGRQTAWFSAEKDLSHGSAPGTPVDLSTRFSLLSENERAVYLAQLVDAHDELIYTTTFATRADIPKRSVLTWGVGEAGIDDPEPAARRRISHVYLPPLRDAVRDLDGGDQALLHDVLRIVVGSDDTLRASFIDTANSALQQVSEHQLAVLTTEAIQSFFAQTTPPNREHLIEINRHELELRRIARLLRIQLAEHQVPIGDIAATGLGYANLLYIAMVVLQLVRAKDSDLTLLLVEEPEAHLHPQLQLVLLDFLLEQAKTSGHSANNLAPTGKVQVVVTTHSPILASTVSIHNVVVVARDGDEPAWCTKATAIRTLGLDGPQRRKIDRYLNSTRAGLLFARDVVLVEGISEMLVLPALAQRHLLSADGGSQDVPEPLKPETAAAATEASPQSESSAVCLIPQTAETKPGAASDLSKDRRRQFRSAALINIEGVDFEPYLRVLLDGDHRRVDRVVVVTDRDHTGAGDDRKEHYENRFRGDAEAGRLIVVVGGTTLEAEMFRLPNNEEVLRKSFLALHPNSEHHWTNVVDKAKDLTPDQRAELFAQAIRAQLATDEVYLDIAKGEFAHVVAEAIESGTAEMRLQVPEYLQHAIDAVAHLTPRNR